MEETESSHIARLFFILLLVLLFKNFQWAWLKLLKYYYVLKFFEFIILVISNFLLIIILSISLGNNLINSKSQPESNQLVQPPIFCKIKIIQKIPKKKENIENLKSIFNLNLFYYLLLTTFICIPRVCSKLMQNSRFFFWFTKRFF